MAALAAVPARAVAIATNAKLDLSMITASPACGWLCSLGAAERPSRAPVLADAVAEAVIEAGAMRRDVQPVDPGQVQLAQAHLFADAQVLVLEARGDHDAMIVVGLPDRGGRGAGGGAADGEDQAGRGDQGFDLAVHDDASPLNRWVRGRATPCGRLSELKRDTGLLAL